MNLHHDSRLLNAHKQRNEGFALMLFWWVVHDSSVPRNLEERLILDWPP